MGPRNVHEPIYSYTNIYIYIFFSKLPTSSHVRCRSPNTATKVSTVGDTKLLRFVEWAFGWYGWGCN